MNQRENGQEKSAQVDHENEAKFWKLRKSIKHYTKECQVVCIVEDCLIICQNLPSIILIHEIIIEGKHQHPRIQNITLAYQNHVIKICEDEWSVHVEEIVFEFGFIQQIVVVVEAYVEKVKYTN